MKRSHVALILVALVILWLSAAFWLPILAARATDWACRASEELKCAETVLERTGSFGDWFGVLNSLFSGLALVGITLTLYMQAEQKRRSAKPLLIPIIKPSESFGGAKIGRPERKAGSVVLPFLLEVYLKNASAQIALNVEIGACLDGRSSKSRVLEVPVAPETGETSEIQLDVKGDLANELVNRLCSSEGACLTVDVSFDSLESVRWQTSVSFNASVRDDDFLLLQSAVDGSFESSPWEDSRSVFVDMAPIGGTWKFSETPITPTTVLGTVGRLKISFVDVVNSFRIGR